jgi:hypothetical protein
MATMQDLLDDLNDRLNDANNAAGAGEANKIRWINRGIAAMWPRIYKTVVDSTIELATDTYEYAIPTAVGDESEIFRVEIEDLTTTNDRFVELDGYDIVPALTGRTLQLPSVPSSWDGARIRITAAKPLARLATTGSTFEGRQIHEELPVWYALGLALARRIEDRTQHTRYSTVAAQNRVDVDEQMLSSQFAFSQFETLLERMQMPWPASVG